MTTGRDALHKIDAAIAEARRELAEVSNAAAGDARELAALDAREIEIMTALANLRIAFIQDGDEANASGLGSAESRAEALIAKHDAHVAGLEKARDAVAGAIENFEAERRGAEETHEAAIAEHERAAQATADRLETDETYQAQAAAVEGANAVAGRAAQKLDLAKADRDEKGAPYEADPLFAYLHGRRFATSGYSAFPLFALLDDWVARLIKFRRHKLNYDRLIELPVRLAEHAERLDAEAADAADALENMERAALEADGVTALRDAVVEAQRALETIDAALAEAEERRRGASEAYAEAASGRTGPYAEARALIVDRLKTMSIPDLKILAAETPTLEDDRLVDDLIGVKRERLELDEEQRAATRRLGRQERVVRDLEDVRRRFKSQRYDSPYSEFRGRDPMGALLNDFIRGVIARDDLWRRIERGHRTRRRDWNRDFGGDKWRGDFGLPDQWGGDWGGLGGMGGSWGGGLGGPMGKRRSRRRVPRAPRPRVRIPRGGGFKTGGRSGGGGFKTGGGF